jgi:hypothetical protein
MQRLRLSISVGPKSTSAFTPSPSNCAAELHPALIAAELIRKILQRALAALVAHRTVEGMVDQRELEDAGARLDDVRRAWNHHAVGAPSTRRLQLRHLFDLDDADAARAVVDPGVITVVGHGDAVLDRGLQDGFAFSTVICLPSMCDVTVSITNKDITPVRPTRSRHAPDLIDRDCHSLTGQAVVAFRVSRSVFTGVRPCR